MKNYFASFSVLVKILFLVFILFSCKSDEERFWDSVQMNENTNSFAFVFTSTNIAFAGDYTSKIIDRVKEGAVANLDAKNVVLVTMFSSELDPLWNPDSETFFFNYDASGDNSFNNYPAFVNNLKMFNFDTTAFYQAIIDKSKTAAALNIGTLIKADRGELTFYVKIRYNASFSKRHSVAIYLYEKEKIDVQQTTSGEVSNFTHKNVFMSSINGLLGEDITGNYGAGEEKQYETRHNVGNYDLKNLGIVTVVYELDANGKAIGVVNITSN